MSVADRISSLTPEQRALLEVLKKQKAQAAGLAPIMPVARDGDLPLSFAQERLWVLNQLMPGTAAYNIPLAQLAEGDLDPFALQAAFTEIVRRHESLRTTYGANQPVQRIAPPPSPAFPWSLPLVDLSALPAAGRQGEAWRLIREDSVRPFNLHRGPVLRTILFRLELDRHVLLLHSHHIASDGWSMEAMTAEMRALYAAAISRRPAAVPNLPIQYADYAVWQRRWLSGEVMRKQLAYWRGRLDGVPILELPTDRPRPPEPRFQGAVLHTFLSAENSRGAAALARRHEATLFMVVLAAFQTLLARYTGQYDFALGSPIAGRNRPEVKDLIGFFVNTLVFRADLRGDPPFSSLLEEARKRSLEAYSHQDVPFERLVEELRPERRLDHNPLFQVMLWTQKLPDTNVELSGLSLEPFDTEVSANRFELEVVFFEREDGLEARATYSSDLFDATTMQRLFGHLDTLLAGALADPGQRLSELPWLNGHERHQILEEWNDTAAALPEGTLVDLFREQAALRPGAIAVSSYEGDLTFAELDRRSDRLARHLAALGVGPEVRVALLAERSLALVVGMLAVVKAGGAYLPLDPAYPPERLAWMLADSGARVVLSDSGRLDSLPGGLGEEGPSVVELAADPPEPEGAEGRDPIGPLPDGLIYVMYTSGSTGRPKAVGVTHRNIVRLVRESGFADLGPEQVFLQITSISFDVSTLEIWAPLANGGRLALPPAGRLSLDEIGQAIDRLGVTTLWLTSGLFHQMVDHRLEALRPLRQLIAGGDIVSPPHAERALAGLPGVTLIDGYGPTEGTTFTTCHSMTRPEEVGPTVLIGRPMGNTRVLILDETLRPVPPGVYGELCAGGGGVARGYMERPDLTAERFVPDPAGAPGERLYRTGDLARLLGDGRIEFLGRRDGQVKIRGVRVELGEIEAVLARHPAVGEAAVAVREDSGDRRLVGYVVLHRTERTDGTDRTDLNDLSGELRRFLTGQLPEAMVPSVFVVLDALPLSPNGKVDRRALPAPEAGGPGTERADWAPPQSALEIQLAGFFAEVLGVERVGLHDGFFDLGGHSLLATQLLSRLRESLGVELPLRQIFRAPTVAGVAAAVQEVLADEGAGTEATPPIVPVPRDGEIPLSFAQERLWLVDRLIPGSAAYNIPLSLAVYGELRPAVLAAALGEIVRRHEVLRTTFVESSARQNRGRPVQRIAPHSPDWELPLVDLAGLPAAARDGEARRLANDEAGRPFDLQRGPVMRATLLRLAEEAEEAEEGVEGAGHALLLNTHHIASDAWSLGVMTQEVASLYLAAAAGRPSPLRELPIQYADFAAWQRRWLSGAVLESQLGYWRERLRGLPVLQLPTDRPRPAEPSFRGDTLWASLGEESLRAARTLARRQDATLFMVLLAAFHALLERYTGQDDLATGTPIANRNRAEVEPLIGFFVNYLVLRSDLAGDPRFSELLERTRVNSLEGFAHQDLPFDRLVEELRPDRRLAHNPLFQVSVGLQNTPMGRVEFPGLSLAAMDLLFPTSHFDLEVTFWEAEEGLVAQLNYGTDIFEAATIRRLGGHLEALLAGAVADPEVRLSALPLLAGHERHQLLREWNDTAAALPEATLVDLFREQAALRPGAVAVVSADGELTFAELDARSERLARRLAGVGVGPEMPVALLADRSHALVVGLLAILKAGGAYLPLDPAYPAERLSLMLADSGALVLLGKPALIESLPAGVWAPVIIELAADPEEPGPYEPQADPAGPLADGLAYVMYTSGSTGRPKAVAVTHRNVVRLVRESGFADLGPEQVFLQLAPASFDAATLEIWAPLANGGRLALPSAGPLSLDEIGHAIEAWGVTTLWLTAGLFHTMVDSRLEALRPLRQLLAGGDVLSPAHVERALAGLPEITLINGYGPTEGTTFTSCHAMRRLPVAAPVPIGRPIGNTRVLVLDREGGPAPIGTYGELCAGGGGVARGYFGRPELTAERFVPAPLGDPSGGGGERLYRTGDLARFLPDGRIEFLGRRDGQVKLRGYRVELGEVEATLARHPQVREAAAVLRDDPDRPGDKRLVGFVVLHPTDPTDRSDPSDRIASLRRFLGEELPDYMVPSALVELEALPLSPNGKVDRAALPALSAASGRAGEQTQVAPRTPVESRIAGFYAEVLGRESVGIHEDFFFDLGGHSLLATQVVSRLRESLGVELPLYRMFEAPTVEGLARLVEEEIAATGGEAAPPILPVPREPDLPLPLSFAQERLWLLDRLLPGMAAYNVFLPLAIEGALSPAVLEAALREMVRRHETLRTTFGESPTSDGGSWPEQRIAPPYVRWALPLVDLAGLPAATRTAEVQRLAEEDAGRPFNLERGPMLRTTLLRTELEAGHVLLLCIHHIASDGWSLGVMTREIVDLYAAAAAGRPSSLPELRIQYADFAVWQRQWLSGEVLERQIAYWRDRLTGLPVLQLPTDRPRPATPSFGGAAFGYPFDAATTRAVRDLARRHDATLFMVLLAAFQALLARTSGQTDFAVGSPIANRNRAEVEPLIGFFVNSLVLRGDLRGLRGLRGEPRFADLVEQARRTALEAFSHQDLPFERIVEELRPDRRLADNPLFQVMFAVQNAPLGRLEIPGLSFGGLDLGMPASRFDLEVTFWEVEEELAFQLTYSTDLFDATTARRLASHFDELLAAAIHDPEQPLSDLPLLAGHERHQLLHEWNDTGMELPAATLADLFREQAARRPGAVAVVSAEGELTYAVLDARSDRLARRLAALGVGPEVPVAIVAQRSPAMVVGLLAILKAGGAYLPLDLAYPAERLAWMLADVKADVLLGPPELLATLPPEVRVSRQVELSADADEGTDDAGDASRVPVGPLADGIACFMYTSGSTGRPKAVGVTHANIVRLVRVGGFADLGPDVVFLQFAPVSFDASTLEIWAPLSNGGRLALPPPGPLSIEEMGREIARWGGNTQVLTTGLFNQIVDSGLDLLRPFRQLMVGGEALSPSHIRRARVGLPDTRLTNSYGPTEVTTFTATHHVTEEDDAAATVPIGRPIGETRVFALDAAMGVVPVGVYGELYAGGRGVARGYMGRPDVTAERFVPDPFATDPGERLYRTGDLVSFRGDGVIDFLGRRDGQVKIRGFRVELGEIETALARHPAVREVTVMLRESPDRSGDKRLVAYGVLDPTDPTDRTDPSDLNDLHGDLRRFLGAALPDYMIPSAFVWLEVLPLLPNGKVNRKALPEPALAGGGAVYAPPETPVEIRLAAVFGEVLSVARVGRDDSFFDLGGHSLLATQVISRLRAAFGIELPLRRLFEAPTVARLARVVEEKRADESTSGEEIPRTPRGEPLPVSFSQERLWVLDHLLGGGTAYSVPMALRLAGDLEVPALAATLGEIVRRHEALRTVFADREGAPVQIVLPAAPQPLPVIDLGALGKVAEAEARQLAEAEALRPFDLSAGPLLRTALIRLGAREHLLLANMHHIVSDGWSMGVLVREVGVLYGAFLSGRPSPLPELPIQYADFAVWQRQWLSGAVLAEHLGWWRERLAGAPVLELPSDRPRGAVQSFRGATRGFVASARLSEEIATLARRQGATPFMVLAAGLFAVLSRYSGQPDLTIGTPIANRNRMQTEELIGFFVNALALRVDVGRARSFLNLLEQVREITLGAYAHQDLPFEKLVEELQPQRDPSRTPLYQVVLAMQNAPVGALDLPGLEAMPVDLPATTAKFDLSFSAVEAGDLLAGGVEYVTDLYDGTTVTRLCEHWLGLLAGAAADPEAHTVVLDLLGEAERHQVLREWNDTRLETAGEALLHQLFEARADEDPAALAAVWAGESLTYGELEERSNRLAGLLRRLGVGREAMAGVWMERSLDMLVAVLGTLKAGAAYLPIDNGWPVARAEAVLAGSGAQVVLTRQSHLRPVLDLAWRLPRLDDVICLDVATEAPLAEPVEAGEVQALFDGVAERAVDWVTAAGFYSSYTGEPFAEAEVIEYRDRVVGLAEPWIGPEKIGPEKRVLEIGSGSGLILWEVAPRVARYVGLDPSERTQQANRERAAREGLQQVELETGFAHEIDRFAPGSFDLVILASTVQFFPGLIYLEQVVERAMELLAPGGAVVMADVLDPRRQAELQRSLAEHGARLPEGSGDDKLQVDEGFFLDLARHLPAVGEVALHPRREGFANELRFRYDVVLEKAMVPHAREERRKRISTGWHVAGSPAERLEPVISPLDLAYVIHTSGSTGEPKGIAVQHRPAVELVRWVNRSFGVGRHDRLLFVTSLAFDLSVYDIFGVLGAGGVVHVVPEAALRDPQALAGMLANEPVTIWDSAPAALQQLAPLFPERMPESRLRLVLLSGDWVPVSLPDQVRTSFPAARVVSLGGATEATVWSNWYPVGAVDPAWPSIPYGRPIDNAVYHVLDERLEPCPIGVPGDLYIGGSCLCVGYARMPEATAQSFVPDPFAEEPGARLYKTGDRARYGADGNLEFLGRVDQQVKVRGYRIELEEIEAALARHPGVRDAVVTVREDVAGDKRLVGYVVPSEQPAPTSSQLRSALQQRLPEYMVPWTFVVLDSLPVTANGKVDRKALPAPKMASGEGFMAPRNELERAIAAAWREVLGVQQVGVHDNLFELGGSSLLVVKLHGRLEKELGRKLPMMDLFRHTTIDALARHLAQEEPQRESGADQARARTQTRREALAQLQQNRNRRRGKPE